MSGQRVVRLVAQGPGVKAHFDGATYSPADDDARLTDQLQKVKALMLDGVWRTLREISELTGEPQASISAQLRHLRKPRFGSYVVGRRVRGERSRGLYEYALFEPLESIDTRAAEIAELREAIARARVRITRAERRIAKLEQAP